MLAPACLGQQTLPLLMLHRHCNGHECAGLAGTRHQRAGERCKGCREELPATSSPAGCRHQQQCGSPSPDTRTKCRGRPPALPKTWLGLLMYAPFWLDQLASHAKLCPGHCSLALLKNDHCQTSSMSCTGGLQDPGWGCLPRCLYDCRRELSMLCLRPRSRSYPRGAWSSVLGPGQSSLWMTCKWLAVRTQSAGTCHVKH